MTQDAVHHLIRGGNTFRAHGEKGMTALGYVGKMHVREHCQSIRVQCTGLTGGTARKWCQQAEFFVGDCLCDHYLRYCKMFVELDAAMWHAQCTGEGRHKAAAMCKEFVRYGREFVPEMNFINYFEKCRVDFPDMLQCTSRSPKNSSVSWLEQSNKDDKNCTTNHSAKGGGHRAQFRVPQIGHVNAVDA